MCRQGTDDILLFQTVVNSVIMMHNGQSRPKQWPLKQGRSAS